MKAHKQEIIDNDLLKLGFLGAKLGLKEHLAHDPVMDQETIHRTDDYDDKNNAKARGSTL